MTTVVVDDLAASQCGIDADAAAERPADLTRTKTPVLCPDCAHETRPVDLTCLACAAHISSQCDGCRVPHVCLLPYPGTGEKHIVCEMCLVLCDRCGKGACMECLDLCAGCHEAVCLGCNGWTSRDDAEEKCTRCTAKRSKTDAPSGGNDDNNNANGE